MELEEMTQQKKKEKKITAGKLSGFQCPFCGNYTKKPREYYSSLTTILITKLIKLLNSDKGQGHFEGVMDSIYAIFGPKNLMSRRELELAGYLEKYDQHHGIDKEDLSNQGPGRLRCYQCGQIKDDVDMTIDCISPYRHEDICGDCYAKKEINKKEDVTNNGPDSKRT